MAKRIQQSISLVLASVFLLLSATLLFSPSPEALSASSQFSFEKADLLREEASPLVSAPVSLRVAAKNQYEGLSVYAGGIPFGVKFMTDGVIIVGFHDLPSDKGTINPARAAKLQCGDVILAVGDTRPTSAEELTALVADSGGKPLSVRYSRGGVEAHTTLSPVYSKSENRYVSGLYVRDSGAGIGTVTFVLPETGAFAGLGHGICDGGSGKLIPMQRGSVVNVTINGVVRGLAGSPGEVKGYFRSGKVGSLIGNTECGVFGVFAKIPENLSTEKIPVGLRNELREGKAILYCTLDGEKPEAYEITVSEILRDATGNKCFTVKVTDKALLAKTGGIIQGMSGSPIIQNGKLVGAVTHVLINDPTTGYGIFIENMLNAAQMPLARAS